MLRLNRRALLPLLVVAALSGGASAQQALRWEQVRERFRIEYPTRSTQEVLR
jgi:hypothetical protein